MRFLRQSIIGLFLAASHLGFLVLAADLIRGAFQQRLTDTPLDRVPRERTSVDVRIVHRYHTQPILGAIDAPRHPRNIDRPRPSVVGQRHGTCERHP